MLSICWSFFSVWGSLDFAWIRTNVHLESVPASCWVLLSAREVLRLILQRSKQYKRCLRPKLRSKSEVFLAAWTIFPDLYPTWLPHVRRYSSSFGKISLMIGPRIARKLSTVSKNICLNLRSCLRLWKEDLWLCIWLFLKTRGVVYSVNKTNHGRKNLISTTSVRSLLIVSLDTLCLRRRDVLWLGLLSVYASTW